MAPSLDAEATVKAFKTKHGMDDCHFLSSANASAKAFGVDGYPHAFIVGKDGKILWAGHPEAEDFIPTIEKALGPKEAAAPVAAPVVNKPLRILPRADEDVIEEEK